MDFEQWACQQEEQYNMFLKPHRTGIYKIKSHEKEKEELMPRKGAKQYVASYSVVPVWFPLLALNPLPAAASLNVLSVHTKMLKSWGSCRCTEPFRHKPWQEQVPSAYHCCEQFGIKHKNYMMFLTDTVESTWLVSTDRKYKAGAEGSEVSRTEMPIATSHQANRTS